MSPAVFESVLLARGATVVNYSILWVLVPRKAKLWCPVDVCTFPRSFTQTRWLRIRL